MNRPGPAQKWKKLLSEMRRSLTEAPKPELEDGEDSLDAQIDKFFIDYETEAKNSKNEGRDFRSFVRRFLTEAEEDEEKDKEEKSEEEAEEDKAGDEKEKPKSLTSEDINMQSFVTDVMRLVDNYDTLLEIRNTILRRASNFIAKNYEPDVVELFKSELLDSYGIEIGKSDSEMEDKYAAPKAGAAGPMGGGA